MGDQLRIHFPVHRVCLPVLRYLSETWVARG
jgi:hypothetical protein